MSHIPLTRTQVLVRVTHAGVNGGCETFRVRGEHLFAGNRHIDHYLLGAEGCGTIVAIGAPGPTLGAPPLALHTPVSFGGGGAFGEYALVPAARCFALPEGVPPGPQAVALALSGTVANTALQAVAGVRAGETVLVTAAAGGTGHLAVQVAQLVGARVVATCGGGVKAARLRGLGVHRVIDYTQEVCRGGGTWSMFFVHSEYKVSCTPTTLTTCNRMWEACWGKNFHRALIWCMKGWVGRCLPLPWHICIPRGGSWCWGTYPNTHTTVCIQGMEGWLFVLECCSASWHGTSGGACEKKQSAHVVHSHNPPIPTTHTLPPPHV